MNTYYQRPQNEHSPLKARIQKTDFTDVYYLVPLLSQGVRIIQIQTLNFQSLYLRIELLPVKYILHTEHLTRTHHKLNQMYSHTLSNEHPFLHTVKRALHKYTCTRCKVNQTYLGTQLKEHFDFIYDFGLAHHPYTLIRGTRWFWIAHRSL